MFHPDTAIFSTADIADAGAPQRPLRLEEARPMIIAAIQPPHADPSEEERGVTTRILAELLMNTASDPAVTELTESSPTWINLSDDLRVLRDGLEHCSTIGAQRLGHVVVLVERQQPRAGRADDHP